MNSFSQNQEDLQVAQCFHEDFKGLLVEIGAWFPIEFSNSRLLIERGWDAVLCEFSPLAVDRQVRQYGCLAHECQVPEYGNHDRVRIIQAAITPNERHVERFHITEDALSTNDPEQVERWKNMRPDYHGGFYGTLWVPTLSWDQLKDQFFPKRVPDFISVDTEGSSTELAIAILQSNWRPKVLCAEHNGRDVEIWQEAKKHGYVQIDKTSENIILRRDR